MQETETEVKYDFRKLQGDLYSYIENNELSDSNKKIFNEADIKLKNVWTLIDKLDEDLVDTIISSDYNTCVSYINSFIGGNTGYLTHVNTAVDGILTKLMKVIDYNMLYGNKTQISGYIKGLKSAITKQERIVESEVETILEKIEGDKKNIDNSSSVLNTKVQGISDKLENMETSISSLEKDMDSMIEEQQKKVELERITMQEGQKQSFNILSDEYHKKFDNLFLALQEKDKKISTLLGIVGEKGKIGEYKNHAVKSRNERVFWQKLTVALFVISFVILLYLTKTVTDIDKMTIFKFALSAIVMSASVYTGKQASNCRKDEVYYQKQYLELASIDVYLEGMSDELKTKIKEDLAGKIFGQAQNTYANKYEDAKGISLEDVNILRDTLGKK